MRHDSIPWATTRISRSLDLLRLTKIQRAVVTRWAGCRVIGRLYVSGKGVDKTFNYVYVEWRDTGEIEGRKITRRGKVLQVIK